MAGEHAGHRQRMRERFRTQGLDGFADHEVLELLLFYAIPQRNVNPLAHELLAHFGSLHGVLDAPVEALAQAPGVGEYAATLLSLFSHVSRRLEKSRQAERKVLKNRGDAQRHCLQLLNGQRLEHFYTVCLDAQMRIVSDALIARGSLGEVPAYPRLVVEAALRYNAYCVVLCHNHPGGSLVPSQQDVEVTRKLAELLEGVGISVADHIIVADGEALSMVNCGLLTRSLEDDRLLTRVADAAGEVRIRSELQKKHARAKE